MRLKDRQAVSEALVSVHRLLDGLTALGNVATDARKSMATVVDAQEIVRTFAFDESAIRADERAKVEAEIVAWLRRPLSSFHPLGDYGIDAIRQQADAIERGEHRKP